MEIRFLSVGCGDGIHIRYQANDAQYINIFIDGGQEGGEIYIKTLRKEIEEIILKGEQIDLWIITHIDDDHIGGILRFVKDQPLRKQLNLAKTEFWFNYNPCDYLVYPEAVHKKSVGQGIRLREFLASETLLNQEISVNSGTMSFKDVQLFVLTPNRAQIGQLKKRWKEEEVIIRQKRLAAKKASRPNDYQIPLADFEPGGFIEDKGDFNASSISFILTYNNKCALFLADSHPSAVVASLKNLGYSVKKKLKVNFMQLAHHGSKYNTNDELLQLIDCDEFVISADGFNKHNLPHKALIARVSQNYTGTRARISLTHKNAATIAILKNESANLNIQLEFPDTGSYYITKTL